MQNIRDDSFQSLIKYSKLGTIFSKVLISNYNLNRIPIFNDTVYVVIKYFNKMSFENWNSYFSIRNNNISRKLLYISQKQLSLSYSSTIFVTKKTFIVTENFKTMYKIYKVFWFLN